MAKIKQFKSRLELNPNKLWEETVVYICYDNQSRRGYYEDEKPRFYVKLPLVVAGSLGIAEVRGTTQETAEKAFMEAIEKFKSLKTEINRVILYEIAVEPKPGEGRSASWITGYKVNVWAGCYEETVAIAGDGGRRYSYQASESSLGFPGEYSLSSRTSNGSKRFDKQVPWTEKNEAFFKWVADNMARLIDGLISIESPEKMVEAINAGRLLPLGNSDKGA